MNMDYWRAVFEEQIEAVKPRDSWRLTMDRSLDFHNVEPRWMKSLQEHAHGSFTCSRCYHSWSSHQVVVLFHMHLERYDKRGSVKMRTFRQQCHRCSSDKYEEPQFSEEDVARIVECLIFSIRKKCYGEPLDDSRLFEVVYENRGPHKHEHCEACHLGIHNAHHRWPRRGGHHRELQRPASLPVILQESKAGSTTPSSLVTPKDQAFANHVDPNYCQACCASFILIAFVIAFLVYWPGNK
ncbi:receptor-transporting protein 2-like [Zootoca vivipara]|uniref:receptor-transporting protein 2-like n=1 Tax=Zootoca vivipara TaxID=8524 RepID=UPI001590B305|nr:receptor-transporting protein 2-like [Zootoca vivipara]